MYDGLGSVLAEVDPSGNVTAGRKYDVYGLVRSGQAGISKHKFVGQLGHPSEDETGLIYMQARYMDPVLGKFISEDPKQQGLNWYTYCDNNPVNLVDPTGKTAEWPWQQWVLMIQVVCTALALSFIYGSVFLFGCPALVEAAAVLMIIAITAASAASVGLPIDIAHQLGAGLVSGQAAMLAYLITKATAQMSEAAQLLGNCGGITAMIVASVNYMVITAGALDSIGKDAG